MSTKVKTQPHTKKQVIQNAHHKIHSSQPVDLNNNSTKKSKTMPPSKDSTSLDEDSQQDDKTTSPLPKTPDQSSRPTSANSTRETPTLTQEATTPPLPSSSDPHETLTSPVTVPIESGIENIQTDKNDHNSENFERTPKPPPVDQSTKQSTAEPLKNTTTSSDQKHDHKSHNNSSNFHYHNRHYPDNRVSVRFLIPAKAAGAIIGKGGQNIKELRDQFQAQIAIPDAPAPERVVRIQLQLVSSMEKVVVRIAELLKDDIMKFRRPKTNDLDYTEMRMLVHQSQAGAIIGPKGTHVKKINEDTGAKINVQTEICPYSTDKIAQITGTPEAISKAVGEILVLFQAFPPKGNQYYYDPANFDSNYEYGGYGYNGGYHHYHHHHFHSPSYSQFPKNSPSSPQIQHVPPSSSEGRNPPSTHSPSGYPPTHHPHLHPSFMLGPHHQPAFSPPGSRIFPPLPIPPHLLGLEGYEESLNINSTNIPAPASLGKPIDQTKTNSKDPIDQAEKSHVDNNANEKQHPVTTDKNKNQLHNNNLYMSSPYFIPPYYQQYFPASSAYQPVPMQLANSLPPSDCKQQNASLLSNRNQSNANPNQNSSNLRAGAPPFIMHHQHVSITTTVQVTNNLDKRKTSNTYDKTKTNGSGGADTTSGVGESTNNTQKSNSKSASNSPKDESQTLVIDSESLEKLTLTESNNDNASKEHQATT